MNRKSIQCHPTLSRNTIIPLHTWMREYYNANIKLLQLLCMHEQVAIRKSNSNQKIFQVRCKISQFSSLPIESDAGIWGVTEQGPIENPQRKPQDWKTKEKPANPERGKSKHPIKHFWNHSTTPEKPNQRTEYRNARWGEYLGREQQVSWKDLPPSPQ